MIGSLTCTWIGENVKGKDVSAEVFANNGVLTSSGAPGTIPNLFLFSISLNSELIFN